jgi:hypothetical protein
MIEAHQIGVTGRISIMDTETQKQDSAASWGMAVGAVSVIETLQTEHVQESNDFQIQNICTMEGQLVLQAKTIQE